MHERGEQVIRFAESREQERVWRLGEQGELDDAKIVDAVLGERRVFRRRLDPNSGDEGNPYRRAGRPVSRGHGPRPHVLVRD